MGIGRHWVGSASAAFVVVILLALHTSECAAFGGLLSSRLPEPAFAPSGCAASLPGGLEGRTARINGSVGWLEHPTGLTFANSLPELRGGIVNVRRTSLQGIWSSLTLSAGLFDGLTLEVTGAGLADRGSDGLITSNIGLTADFEGDGFEWGRLQSLVRYDVEGDLSLLAGLLVEKTAARLRVTRPSPGNDDFIVWGYIPIVGLQLAQERRAGTAYVRVVGFPAAPGTITFHTWSETSAYSQESRQNFARGYYLEIEAAWGRQIFGAADAWIFGRWNLFHAITPVERALVPAPVREIQWTVDRRSWTVGLDISWNFDLQRIAGHRRRSLPH